MKTNTMKTNMVRKLSAHLAALALSGFVLLGAPGSAQAEEIQVTGPLAGAPAVRQLRLYRQGRFELSPNFTFTLLDEFRRQIFFGLRANYGITDWLAVGVWGGISTSMLGADMDTSLTGEIQKVNASRDCQGTGEGSLECRLTARNLGSDFSEQVTSLNWIAAPQVTAVPFRGKLGLFNSAFVDADLYLFAGAAFVGMDERKACDTTDCTSATGFDKASRLAIAPTFGLGFTFYINNWMAVGAEYRGLPLNMSTGGFDVAGQGPNKAYPDGNFNSSDYNFRFNQMLTLSFNMYLPTQHKVSE